MDDEDAFWRALKRHSREKFDADRARFLAEARAKDDGGWTHHTEHHWSRMLNGKRLDYWPSRKKWRYQQVVRRGDVMAFIQHRDKEMTP